MNDDQKQSAKLPSVDLRLHSACLFHNSKHAFDASAVASPAQGRHNADIMTDTLICSVSHVNLRVQYANKFEDD